MGSKYHKLRVIHWMTSFPFPLFSSETFDRSFRPVNRTKWRSMQPVGFVYWPIGPVDESGKFGTMTGASGIRTWDNSLGTWKCIRRWRCSRRLSMYSLCLTPACQSLMRRRQPVGFGHRRRRGRWSWFWCQYGVQNTILAFCLCLVSL